MNAEVFTISDEFSKFSFEEQRAFFEKYRLDAFQLVEIVSSKHFSLHGWSYFWFIECLSHAVLKEDSAVLNQYYPECVEFYFKYLLKQKDLDNKFFNLEQSEQFTKEHIIEENEFYQEQLMSKNE